MVVSRQENQDENHSEPELTESTRPVLFFRRRLGYHDLPALFLGQSRDSFTCYDLSLISYCVMRRQSGSNPTPSPTTTTTIATTTTTSPFVAAPTTSGKAVYAHFMVVSTSSNLLEERAREMEKDTRRGFPSRFSNHSLTLPSSSPLSYRETPIRTPPPPGSRRSSSQLVQGSTGSRSTSEPIPGS